MPSCSLLTPPRPSLRALPRLAAEEYFDSFGGSRPAVTNSVPGVPLQARLTLGWAF